MPDIIEIEGGIARLVTRQIKYEVPTSDLAQHLVKAQPSTSPILPTGTVALHLNPEQKRYAALVERPPRTELIRLGVTRLTIEDWYDKLGLDDPIEWPHQLSLPIPWEYYWFDGQIEPRFAGSASVYVMENTYLYWSPSRLQNWGDYVYPAQLPNINDNGSICWGDVSSNNDSFAAKINELVNTFYQSEFNDDWGHMRLPLPIPELENIPRDAYGCPEYPWLNWHPINLNWPDSYAPAPINTTNINPPTAWNRMHIEDWIYSLTPARRQGLRNIIDSYGTNR